MTSAPVVVEIAPAESPRELRRSLLEACSQAVRDADCVEQGPEREEAPAGDAPTVVVAIVSWTDGAHVRLEVALRPARQWVTRDIEFDERNPPAERWRAVGLVIGTLASVITHQALPSRGELPPEATPAQAPDTEPPLPSPQAAPPASATLPDRRRPARARATAPPGPLWIDVSAAAGPVFGRGPWLGGGELGGRFRPPSVPVDVSAAVAYAASLGRVDGVRARSLDGFLGLGVGVDVLGPFSVWAHAEGFLRRLEASVDAVEGGGAATASRWIGGARARVDASARVVDGFSVFVGAAGLVSGGTTDVRVHHEEVAAAPLLGCTVRAGVSLAL